MVFEVDTGTGDILMTNVKAANVTADSIKTIWGSIDFLEAGRIQSTDGKMVTDYNNKYEYILG